MAEIPHEAVARAAEERETPREPVRDYRAAEYGNSALPDSSIEAGGSSQTGSIAAALQVAVEKAHRKLLSLAGENTEWPLAKAKYEQIEARDSGSSPRTTPPRARRR